MYLVRAIYVSRQSSDIGPEDLQKILDSSRANNAKHSITGLLAFNRKCFLQCLEGSREKVNQTYNHIISDPRHNEALLLDYREIVEREFGDWTMGFVPESSLTKDILLRFGTSDQFDPYALTGEGSLRLMKILAARL